jgi:probable HAF family extracellular repeat protein
MKEKLRMLGAMACGLAVLACVPARSYAQEKSEAHHHYKLIDLGTLGGPQSVIFETATRPLNNRGTVVGCGDTPNLDPNNPQNPYFLFVENVVDPFIQHVFEWHEGVHSDLGTLPGGTSSCTQWINERGVVVGGATNGLIDPLTGYPEAVAALWKDGKIHNLGTLGGNESVAFAINDHDRVVGWALNTIPDQFTSSVFAAGATQAHAVLWRDGVIQDLGTLGGPDSAAYFVNERGQIAGQSLTNSIPNSATGFPTQDPFLWENGKMLDLGTLGGTNGYPLALNNRGQVAGISNLIGDQIRHPFLWENGVMKDLGTFGGSFGFINWLNDAGEAVGNAEYPGDQVYRPALWKNGAIIDLGTTQGRPCGYALGINSAGQVVGTTEDCLDEPQSRHAFLWENGDIVDLNTLIPPGSDLLLRGASNINDRGQIAGIGVLPNGDFRAFLLIPCEGSRDEVQACEDAPEVKSGVTQSSRARIDLPVETPALLGARRSHAHPIRGTQPK